VKFVKFREVILHNLLDVMYHRAQSEPESVAYRFFQNGSMVPTGMTFLALWQQATAIAARMQAQGLGNDRILLVCESQQLFVVGFYACLLAGAVVVPTAPPRRATLLGRLILLAQDAQTKFILSDSDEMAGAEFGADVVFFDLRQWLADPDLPRFGSQWQAPALHDDSIAFLQYTSGSTGDPKGVMVTHTNLIRNCTAIEKSMAISPESKVLTALPLFHDMGLIGGVLQSMVSGCIAHFMSPAEFVQYPERWLLRIAKFGITNSGGPNFMYDLAAREIEDEDIIGCDLSSWQVAFCGAEPIRAATVARFSERYAGYGFRPGTFYPCYGMAESTLFITGNDVGKVPLIVRHQDSEVVGCGTPGLDTVVEIVDPDTRCRVPLGEEGEIWVAGSSVAKGYWNREQQTRDIFQARLVDGKDTDPPFMRTGDLGCFKQGQLFVTGRLKDLIILYGKKYAPQDLEMAAGASHKALRPDGGAAFSLQRDDVERLIVVFELERSWIRRQADHPEIIKAMRAAITHRYGAHVEEVVLIKPGALPRTSSGKVRRSQCRIDYLAGSLKTVAEP
jgi:acyl-CoA synthetase (AMP-forming)/AMP-acid ligase II